MASSTIFLLLQSIHIWRLFSRDSAVLWKNLVSHFEKWIAKKREDCHRIRQDIYILKNLISSVFFITGTLSKNMRIAIVAAGTFTFWKTWFQACSSRQLNQCHFTYYMLHAYVICFIHFYYFHTNIFYITSSLFSKRKI